MNNRTRRELHDGIGMPHLNPEPVELEHGDHRYLDLFRELAYGRRLSQGIIGTIEPEQIMAWSALFGVPLTVEEKKLILDIDAAYRKAIGIEMERTRAAAASKPS